MSASPNSLANAEPLPLPAPPAVERQAPEAEAGPAAKSGSKRNLALGLGLLVAGGAGSWWLATRGLEDPDDAQIDGDVVNVPARTSGVITAVHFSDNQTVKSGQLLAEIDSQPQGGQPGR